MEILVFGASGATGHELVRQALEKGHTVTAFVRNPGRLQIRHSHLRVVEGNVKDYGAVSGVMHSGHDAVLCALGAKSPLKRDKTLVNGVRDIVSAMEENGIGRIIYLSFAGVSDSRKQLPLLFGLFAGLIMGAVIADHEQKERIIMKSSLSWTIVRPALLSQGTQTGRVIGGEDLKIRMPNLKISRADVADFMLRQVSDNTFLKKTPLVGV